MYCDLFTPSHAGVVMAVRKNAKKAAANKQPAAKLAAVAAAADEPSAVVSTEIQEFLRQNIAPRRSAARRAIPVEAVRERLVELNITPTVSPKKIAATLGKLKIDGSPAMTSLTTEVQASVRAMKPETRRLHGSRVALSWFPLPPLVSPCANKFGYLSSAAVRAATKLPFNAVMQALLAQLGNMMGDAGRDPNLVPTDNPADAGNSTIPAGYTYFGQFVDHDITLDVSSSLSAVTNANTIDNMRSPTMDLDSVYGRGPGLDPFLYVFPSGGPATAIKLKVGSNSATGPGGPSSFNGPGGMLAQTNRDVPRMAGTNTAVIGDPRNDENLIVSQFHHAMLRLHNAVVDLLLLASFPGDIFAEAKRITTHHYQWAVMNDFLVRVCGAATVSAAMASVVAPVGSTFRMPVEFAVAAYRFGHSMIRDNYWVNFNFPQATLGQVFSFIRNPLLPVFSNWVVDFNAYFDTGLAVVPVHNLARKIDSNIAMGLESLPGFAGMMAVLAARNLARGHALELPSGQGMAGQFGIAPMTAAQLTSGLPAPEVALLNSNGGVLLNKTPLWYYVLRESAVLQSGNRLGPVGGRIVAETFVRMLKRDAGSYINAVGGFVPFLPSAVDGQFTVGDLVNFAGVTTP
jgi:hypothetical protein